MLARVILLQSLLGIIFGSAAGILARLFLSDQARRWLDSDPVRAGFVLGFALLVIVMGSLLLMLRWRPLRRYVGL